MKRFVLGLVLASGVAHADCVHRDLFGHCMVERNFASQIDLTLSGNRLRQDDIQWNRRTNKPFAELIDSPVLLGYGTLDNRMLKRH